MFAVLFALALLAIIAGPALAFGDARPSPCNRIQVESRDRGVLLNSYVVSEPEYVARKRAEIDENGQEGSWTVSAGELGLVGYTVTYSCLN